MCFVGCPCAVKSSSSYNLYRQWKHQTVGRNIWKRRTASETLAVNPAPINVPLSLSPSFCSLRSWKRPRNSGSRGSNGRCHCAEPTCLQRECRGAAAGVDEPLRERRPRGISCLLVQVRVSGPRRLVFQRRGADGQTEQHGLHFCL
ncbi:hypothetical protein AAFF_G00363900 [Aldrovandia affinis]|uniref:Uncharacterized protein n=1 Tax=Aldrovandia affinis TaxID=143900 RepID=A0AAD7WN02_9TELE|nr:hypothetical protein AAFF_G00363900 [Aldrovandia affinis]